MTYREAACHDPVALDTARGLFSDNPRIAFLPDMYEAVEGADAEVIVTEWKVFHNPNLPHIRSALHWTVTFDGRNLFTTEQMRKTGKAEYHPIGRPTFSHDEI